MRSEEELNQALDLHHKNLQATLRRVAKSHFEIVLDFVLRDEEALSGCLEALSARFTIVVGVYCPLEVLEERERARADRGIGMAQSQFGHSAYDRKYSMKIDTSKVTPEEGAQMIRDYIHTHVAPNTAANSNAAQGSHLLP